MNQQFLALKNANTGMVVLNDIGLVNDYHPKNKMDVGLRLSQLALNKTYGFTNIVPHGPLFTSSVNQARSILIEFNSPGSDLMVGEKPAILDPIPADVPWLQPTIPSSAPLGGFQICGEDRVWKWADGKTFLHPNKGGEATEVKGWMHQASATANYNALNDKWNQCEIIVMGDQYTIHKLNGDVVNIAVNLTPGEGIIGFQSETAEIFYRNIIIKEFDEIVPMKTFLE
jgi:hypothetical protein